MYVHMCWLVFYFHSLASKLLLKLNGRVGVVNTSSALKRFQELSKKRNEIKYNIIIRMRYHIMYYDIMRSRFMSYCKLHYDVLVQDLKPGDLVFCCVSGVSIVLTLVPMGPPCLLTGREIPLSGPLRLCRSEHRLSIYKQLRNTICIYILCIIIYITYIYIVCFMSAFFLSSQGLGLLRPPAATCAGSRGPFQGPPRFPLRLVSMAGNIVSALRCSPLTSILSWSEVFLQRAPSTPGMPVVRRKSMNIAVFSHQNMSLKRIWETPRSGGAVLVELLNSE